MSYHYLPVALDLEKSFLWPHTSTEPLPPSFFHPVSLEVSFHIPSPFPPLLASESTPFGGFLAFKPGPSCEGPWHPTPHLTDLSLSVLHIGKFNTGARFLLSTSFCYWKWHPAAWCSEANTSETQLVVRKVMFYFGGQQLEERVDFCPKADPSLTLTISGWVLKGNFRGAQVEGGGSMQKQHGQLCQSSWNWTSVVWSAPSWLSSVLNLQFQGWFVSISLRPALRIVAA